MNEDVPRAAISNRAASSRPLGAAANGAPKPQRAKSTPHLGEKTMLHLADRDDHAFCGAKDGDRTFEHERVDCPDCIRMIREAERQDRRDESGGG